MVVVRLLVVIILSSGVCTARGGVWATPGGKVPLGFYGYGIADPPCNLLRNSTTPPSPAPGCTNVPGPPTGWSSNQAFWREYSAAGFTTLLWEYETRNGYSAGLDYLHGELKLPIFPILGLQNNIEFEEAKPNHTQQRLDTVAL